MPIGFYGMATCASRVGEWEDAARHHAIFAIRDIEQNAENYFADFLAH